VRGDDGVRVPVERPKGPDAKLELGVELDRLKETGEGSVGLDDDLLVKDGVGKILRSVRVRRNLGRV
jgi:hypothetical protein